MRVHLSFLERKTDFLISYLPPWMTRSFKKGSTLKGKNILDE